MFLSNWQLTKVRSPFILCILNVIEARITVMLKRMGYIAIRCLNPRPVTSQVSPFSLDSEHIGGQHCPLTISSSKTVMQGKTSYMCIYYQMDRDGQT